MSFADPSNDHHPTAQSDCGVRPVLLDSSESRRLPAVGVDVREYSHASVLRELGNLMELDCHSCETETTIPTSVVNSMVSVTGATSELARRRFSKRYCANSMAISQMKALSVNENSIMIERLYSTCGREATW